LNTAVFFSVGCEFHLCDSSSHLYTHNNAGIINNNHSNSNDNIRLCDDEKRLC